MATGRFDMTLPKKNNLELSGSVTQLPGFENKIADTAKKATQNFKGAREFAQPYVKDVVTMGPEAAAEGWLDSLRLKNLKEQFKTIISVTVGSGKILAHQSFRTRDVNKYEALKPTIEEDTHIGASKRIAGFFERDSADFSGVVQSLERDNIVRLLTARDMIELFLALNLALVMNPDKKIELLGHASPEGPIGPLPEGKYDPYNLDLSEDRVDAVHRAILDAMKMFPTNAWATVEMDWKGEAVSRDPVASGGGGLHDPPGTTNALLFLQWLKTHKDEVEKWPNWRRVDVRIGGVALLRLYDW